MTLSLVSRWVGKEVHIRVEDNSFTIPCTVLDFRQVYQRIDIKVTPKNGAGEKWISTERVTAYEN